MDRCWQLKPSKRPSFIGILEELEEDLSQDFRQVSFYHNQNNLSSAIFKPETEGAGEYTEETVADDELNVDTTTSLLYGSQPEKQPLYPMDSSHLSPLMPADKLTYRSGEGSSVADRFVDNNVSVAGVSERLLGGQGDAAVHQSNQSTECSREAYTDALKSTARPNRLTNGHIPYQSVQPSDGVKLRVGLTNC